MKTPVLTIAAIMAVGFSTAVLAGHHEGDEGEHKGHKMFEKIDESGDGLISKQEFINKHEQKFSEMDVNGDGSLSKDEMKAHHEKWKEKMKERREDRKEKSQEKQTSDE